MLKWNGDAAFESIRRGAAQGLLRAATFFETQHSIRVASPNPPPYRDSSRAGEYPKLRTGAGRSGLSHEPVTLAEAAASLQVRVGFRKGRHHLLILELSKRFNRLGLERTMKDLQPQLASLATSEFVT